MKLDKILEYQKVDQELIALENAFARSDERQKMLIAKNKVEEAGKRINDIKAEAGGVMGSYNAMKSKLADIQEELNGFDGILDDVQDPAEADYYLKTLNAIYDKLAALEKEANQAAGKADKMNDNYRQTWDTGVKASEAFKTAKAAFDKKMDGVKPQVEDLKKRLAAISKDVPPQLMAKYNELRAARRVPAFVEYDVQQNACGRCFMELPNDARSKLKNPGDMAECPNCHRVLYVPEN